MLDRILVPLDTSPVAEQVLPYVRLLAKQLEQPVHLLSVIVDGEALNPLTSLPDAAIASLMQHRQQYAQKYLDATRARLEADGIEVTTEVRMGRVADEIAFSALSQATGLIAMATHGRVGPERWFLGSASDGVLRTAPCPVLLIRPHEQAALQTPSISQVLVPLDGSSSAEQAVPYASFIAKAFKAPALIVRTVPTTWLGTADPYTPDTGMSPELLEILETDAKDCVARTAEQLERQGIRTKTHAALGEAAGTITDFARATPGTLVVMASHGRTGLGRTLLGSVADRVVRSSAAPVLVVRVAEPD